MEDGAWMVEKNILTVRILEGVERSKGCPLCYLWNDSEERYLKHVLTNEVVMDSGFREKLIAARGFCNRHAHMLYRAIYGGDVHDGLGYALYMKDIVEKVLEDLHLLSTILPSYPKPRRGIVLPRSRKRRIATLREAVEPKTRRQQCPICEHLWSMNQIYLHTLVQMLDDEEFREEFSSSKELCLPHLLSAIQILYTGNLKNPASIAQALINSEIKHLQSIQHLLSEFIRKQSWEFRDEPHGPEVNANHLALHFLFGSEGLRLK
jgi:hypothetical protein